MTTGITQPDGATKTSSMRCFWREKFRIGSHPNAPLWKEEHRGMYGNVSLHVSAFYADEQRVLLIEGTLGYHAPRCLTPLEHLVRLSSDGAPTHEVQLVRAMQGVVDAYLGHARERLEHAEPLIWCTGCDEGPDHQDLRCREEIAVPDLILPAGWSRGAQVSGVPWFLCPRHAERQRAEEAKRPG